MDGIPKELFYRPNPPYMGMKCPKCWEEMGMILDEAITIDINDPGFYESMRILMQKYEQHECD